MQKIKIISVGKMKRGPVKELADELRKRLGPYFKLEEQVVHELTGNLLDSQDTAILLAEDGNVMDSITFAKNLSQWSDHGQRELTFIIAGPFGFDHALLKHADHVLSLSPMTFPHEMAYVILLEQLYRAGTILAGKTYHY
jgi:23S rRNA (pseudouridine1915-N3)-methyltransferase